MSTADDKRTYDFWTPESDPEILKHVGKLGEECCELGASLFRVVVQGLTGVHPVTGKPNSVAVREEISDVKAMIGHIEERYYNLERKLINERAYDKRQLLLPWLQDELTNTKPDNPAGG